MAGTVLQMMAKYDEESVECCRCGVIYASNVISIRRKDGQTFYCPNGHPQVFRESEADKLRKQLVEEKLKRAEAEREKEWAVVRQRDAESKTVKVEKKLRLQTKRINAGVCPHCNRTFQQLARHMQCKHAEIAQ